jgi:hypothetical protein
MPTTATFLTLSFYALTIKKIVKKFYDAKTVFTINAVIRRENFTNFHLP